MRKVILASASPRRRELLKEIVSEFDIVVSNADETILHDMAVEEIPRFLATLKACDVAQNHKDEVVIGSDTVVVVDSQVLGKPKDENDAFSMLKMLSGRKHQVMTGCAIVCGEKKHSFTEITEVEFFELSDDEIRDYIKTKDPMDKAGAYGIQSKGKTLVKGIFGDYYNVVGLPIGRLRRELDMFMKTID
ncbi:MAG: septum formation inhibitor Maf [Ruminococcus sp.]|nr:septum formation inhibitor Maf [Ruminococcus sp.]